MDRSNDGGGTPHPALQSAVSRSIWSVRYCRLKIHTFYCIYQHTCSMQQPRIDRSLARSLPHTVQLSAAPKSNVETASQTGSDVRRSAPDELDELLLELVELDVEKTLI